MTADSPAMELRPYRPEDEPGVLNLWRRTLDDRFPMRARLWRQQTSGDPAFRDALCLVAWVGGEAAGLALAKVNSHAFATNARYAGTGAVSILLVRPDHRGRGIGSALLARSEVHLRAAGANQVRLGAGLEHTFPGVPVGEAADRRFFEHRGYEFTYEVSDLVLEPDGYSRLPKAVAVARAEGADFGPCRQGEEQALLDFLERTFPGGWCYWTEKRLRAGDRNLVFLMRLGGRLTGFAHLYTSRTHVIGPPVFWSSLLGPRFGGLGPLGIGADVRGRGLGAALLCAAVDHLHGLGVRRISIDWTDLPGFYARAGFRVWRGYCMSAVKTL